MNPAKIKEYMDPENTQTIPVQPTPVPVQSIQSVQSISPTKKSKLPLILGILVLLVIVGVMGVVWGKYLFGQKTETVQPVVTVTTTTPTPTVDPTANWKTYTNSDLGYSILYPNNWTIGSVDKSAAPTIRFDPIDVRGEELTAFYIRKINQTKEEFIKEWGNNGQVQPENVTINGNDATLLQTTSSPGSKIMIVFIPTTKMNFVIEAPSPTNAITKQEVLGMMFTFKITDQNQTSDTTNWKTITLNKLSFKIPNNWWSSNPQTDNVKTGYSWVNINPTALPVPGDAAPGFALYYEQNKTPVQIRDEYIKQWGMTDVSESTLKQFPADILLFEGNTQPGYLESKRFQVVIISNGNDSYYLVDLTLVENHKQIFDQIITTFRFIN